MAAGDVYSGLSAAVANNSYLDINPGSGVEAVITNIFYEGAVEFYWYDGTNEIKFLSDASAGALLACSLHVKNGLRVRVKNVSGAAQEMGYDGLQTK